MKYQLSVQYAGTVYVFQIIYEAAVTRYPRLTIREASFNEWEEGERKIWRQKKSANFDLQLEWKGAGGGGMNVGLWGWDLPSGAPQQKARTTICAWICFNI